MNVREMTEDELVQNVPVNAQTWQQAPFLLEMERRVIRELRNFNRTSTRLAVGVIFIAVLQLAVAGVQLYIAAKR